MTRILFPFYGDEMDDRHFAAIHLALDLIDQGLDIQIGSQKLDCPLVDYLEWLGVDWLTIPFTVPMKLSPLWMQRKTRDQICSILVPFVDETGIEIVHTNSLRDHMIWSNLTSKTSIRHVWHERQASTRAMLTSCSNNNTAVVLDPGCATEFAGTRLISRNNTIVLPDEQKQQISTGASNSQLYLTTLKAAYFNTLSL